MQEYIPFFQAEKRSIAEKLAKYFEYSCLETKIHYDEEKDVYILSVPSDKEKEAKKYYQAFYFVERERIEKEEKSNDNDPIEKSSDEDDISSVEEEVAATEVNSTDTDNGDDTSPVTDEVSENNSSTDEEMDEILDEEQSSSKSLLRSSGNSGSYVMKSEKYKDYNGTQFTFIFLGIAGLIFVALNVIEVITFLNGLFPNFVMGALFIFFIIVGISTGKKAKQLKLEIDEENQLTDKINDWLQTTVTEEFLASISNSELSDELDYIKKTEKIREMLISEFGEQNTDYLDRLIEEYYTNTFE
ncbi:MAG: hypothetical protein GX379_09640 [Clostridiales bacterium]|jgi:hypothetical protein|nr:hypothetical protein [Clostridiales bacterium]